MGLKQFVVLGLGRFGSSLARTLYGLGHDVLVVDETEEAVQEISESVTHAVQADATDESTLRSLGLRNFDVAIVAIGSNIQSSILISMIVKELGVKHVVAKAKSELRCFYTRLASTGWSFPKGIWGLGLPITLFPAMYWTL